MAQIVTLTVNPAIDVSTSTGRIAPMHKLRCAPPLRDPGGGGINVARMIARLGGDVEAIYLAGGDTGRLLSRLVAAEGIRHTAIPTREETRTDFTVLEETSGAQYRFVLPGPHVYEAEWSACLDALDAMPAAPAYIVASGSLPPGVPDDFYAQVAAIAARRGARLVLDTAGPALAAALRAGVHLVKPNLRELLELTGTTSEDETAWLDACRRIVKAGQAELVALTLGEQGAALVGREEVLRAAALSVPIRSTVGAGDSFLGAAVWALAAGKDREAALRYGVAAGSASLLAPGTGLAAPADIERLLSEVVVTRA